MSSYIGKAPTNAPLSTADYQDGSVTGVKLAVDAAKINLGYTPFSDAGGTVTGNVEITGELEVNGNVDLQGTTVIDDANVVTLDVSGVATLGADPVLALQAATKQYVDNNFQLATGSIQTLDTDLTLTNASARVFEFTTAAEFVVINLPAANTLTIANGKFVFRNEGKHPIGVKNSAGGLIGAVGPNSTANCYLYDVSTAAGVWSMDGDDVRPFFVSNSGFLPQTGTTVADTMLSTAYALTIKLTETSYIVVHDDNTATNKQVVAYAVDTSTRPASVGNRTVLAALSTTSGVGVLAPPMVAYRVTDTTAYVANASSVTSHVVLTVAGTGITVSNTLAGTFATVPLQHSPVLGEISQMVQLAPDLYFYCFAATAAVHAYYAVKIDGTTIRISTIVNGAVNQGTGLTGWVDARLIDYDAGTGTGNVGVLQPTGTVVPFGLLLNRVTIAKNAAGAAPAITSPVPNIAITGAALAATFNWGWAVDEADPEYGVVFYYANATVFPTYNGVYNLKTGTLTSTAASVIIASAGVATGFQRAAVVANGGTASVSTAGIIGNARGLLIDNYGAGAWRTYLINALSTRFIKLSHVGVTYTATLADLAIPDGTNTVSGLALIGGSSSRYASNTTTTSPAFCVLSTSAMTPAAGQLGGAKLYLMFDQASKINLVDVFAPDGFSVRDALPTLIGLQYMITKNGYFLIPTGAATAATTSEGSFNTWAVFKLGANGSMRYFGRWQLPIKNTREVVFNTQFGVQDAEINVCANGIEFDQVEGIHYRKFLKIEMAIQ
jgi:hypothetical protein